MLTSLTLFVAGLLTAQAAGYTAAQAVIRQQPPQNFQVQGVLQKAFDGYDLVVPTPNGQRTTFHLLFDNPAPPLQVGQQFVAVGIPLMIPNGVRNYLLVRNIVPAPNVPNGPPNLGPPNPVPPPNPPLPPTQDWNALPVFDVTGTPMLRISGVVTCPSPAYVPRLVFVKKCRYGLKLAVRYRKVEGVFPQVVTKVPVSYTVNRYSGGFKWVEVALPGGKTTRIKLGDR